MGVRIGVVYAQVLALSGALAAVSGIMVSSLSTLPPIMGGDPMLKAFIICVVAGLGNVYGAVVDCHRARPAGGLDPICAWRALQLRALLLLVIVVLIWRPYGLFGRKQVVRLCSVRRDLLVGGVLFCALVVPFAAPDRYVITQATLFFIWAIVVTQWNLVLGVGGIFSLAQMALFAVGAYATAMLGYYGGWPHGWRCPWRGWRRWPLRC